jgi:Na+-translocating ferredoxin:NAD+ oxidoreductase subunit G
MNRSNVRLGMILTAFAAIACVGLSFVYAATKDRIAANSTRQLDESLRELFPSADAFSPETISSADPAVSFRSAYVAKDGAAVLGVAITASGKSYNGQTVVLVGVGADARIVGARVLENHDTPGLGANAASQSYFVDRARRLTFAGQFAGKPVSDEFAVKRDVQAISASTITSRAVARIVKAAAVSAGTRLAAERRSGDVAIGSEGKKESSL